MTIFDPFHSSGCANKGIQRSAKSGRPLMPCVKFQIMNTYSSQNWQIDLPESWIGEFDDDIHLIYDPDGVGAIQISAYIKPGGKITEDELLERTGLDEKSYRHLSKNDWGHFHGYQLVYREDEIFWRKWWLMKDNLFIFITYNCEIPDKDIEFKAINAIVNTLKVIKT